MPPAAVGEEGAGRETPAPVRRTIADRALLRAVQVWGRANDARFWERFRPEWRESLRTDEDESRAGRTAVGDVLRRSHAAEARPGLEHVHPSWWVRALKQESPSVQRAVAAHADPALRPILQHGLGLDPADLASDHPPHPDALRWALGLWAERIVGDMPRRADDPPVILALTRLGLREVIVLAQATGLVKLALASESPTLTSRARARFEDFLRRANEAPPTSRSLALRDVGAFVSNRGRGRSRLGLISFGRLLAAVEPYRTRWALQHLPYSLARSIRPAIKDPGGRLAAWEGENFRIAWDRLVAEGRLPAPGGLSREQ
jgi:hypothetical protein